MMIVFAENYPTYTRFLRQHFPYANANANEFCYVGPGDTVKILGCERGTPCIVVGGASLEVRDVIARRPLTEVQINESDTCNSRRHVFDPGATTCACRAFGVELSGHRNQRPTS